MSDLFLDVNVVLDFLLKRAPFDVAALRLFQLADQGQIRLYVSAVTFNNAYYIAARLQNKSKALSLMRVLTKEEVRELSNMARRLAALLAITPELDENYSKLKANAVEWSSFAVS